VTSAKIAIKTLLENATHGVKAYDDRTPAVLIPGHVMDRWPGESEFAAHGWVISVGPVIAADAPISSLGSFSKMIREIIQVDVWVKEKRNLTYAAEKTRSDLVQDVDRCLHHYSASPGTGYKHVNASGWRELDEVGLLRSSLTVEMLYEKAQA